MNRQRIRGCDNQLKELQEQKQKTNTIFFKLRRKAKDKQRVRIQKRKPKYEEEVKALLDKLRAFEDEADDLSGMIEDTKKAIRLLEENVE